MPVWNTNHTISARPNLAIQLVLQILMYQVLPTTFNSILCKKGNSHFIQVLGDGVKGKYLVIT